MSERDHFDFSPEARYGANPERDQRDFLTSILEDEEYDTPRKSQRPKKDKKPKKEKSRKKLFTPVFTVVLIILMAVFGWVGYASSYFVPFLIGGTGDSEASEDQAPITENPGESIASGQKVFLILGSDRREDEAARSDTMMVAFVDFDKYQVRLLSIPRDTYVTVPGYGETKINHSYAYGGVDLVEQTLEENFGIVCDYYVDLNFQGFRDVIDALGGVTINVPKDMDYVNEPQYSDEDIHLKAGVQTLDGDQALQFCRFRKDSQGDLGRIERQQAFLVALKDQIYSPGTLLKIPSLCDAVLDNMSTNLTGAQILQAALYMKDGFDLDTYEPDNDPEYIDEISYVLITDEGYALITSLVEFAETPAGEATTNNLDVRPDSADSTDSTSELTTEADDD